jgi:hypothetical protein
MGLDAFECPYRQIAKPFEWNLARRHLSNLNLASPSTTRDSGSPPDRDRTSGRHAKLRFEPA